MLDIRSKLSLLWNPFRSYFIASDTCVSRIKVGSVFQGNPSMYCNIVVYFSKFPWLWKLPDCLIHKATCNHVFLPVTYWMFYGIQVFSLSHVGESVQRIPSQQEGVCLWLHETTKFGCFLKGAWWNFRARASLSQPQRSTEQCTSLCYYGPPSCAIPESRWIFLSYYMNLGCQRFFLTTYTPTANRIRSKLLVQIN